MKFSLNAPTRLHFGAGGVKNLHALELPGGKPLVVASSEPAMRALGHLDTVLEQLKQAGQQPALFDRVPANPVVGLVADGVALAGECACDYVVALGGGGCISTAKAIAACLPTREPDFLRLAGADGVTAAAPVVAIPTTAGTGAEVSPWVVLTDPEAKEKKIFESPLFYPHTAIVDPELTVTVPPQLTALQGFDAFCHAAEGYISKAHTPISDLYALEALRLLYKYLPVAVADGNNLWARIKVSWAGVLAGMVNATSSCTGLHALEHALSAHYTALPHGAGLASVAPAYFKTLKNDSMKRYMKMAEKMRQVKSARPSDFLDAIDVMMRACGLDTIKMSDWGVSADNFPAIADKAIAAAGDLLDLDPRYMSREELLAILAESHK